MSDVPAAALWRTAVALATGTGRRASLAAGLATRAAILVRPNLVPLGIPIGLLLLRPERRWNQRLRAAATVRRVVSSGLHRGRLQRVFYGSPFSSGCGTLEQIFSTANLLPNAGRYFAWLTDMHTPGWLLVAEPSSCCRAQLVSLLAALVMVIVAVVPRLSARR